MPIVAGEPTHVAVVRVYDGATIEKDQPVRYVGEPNWKYRPLAPAALPAWEESVANPGRVLQENLRTQVQLHPEKSPAEIREERRVRGQYGVLVQIVPEGA